MYLNLVMNIVLLFKMYRHAPRPSTHATQQSNLMQVK